ncbi:MAG: hypothetical protein CL927_17255 [Deltaproteobacteria bacterium]|nr:hypothetical protein [Deltaproteobacteria bacterium]HCH66744.1 hypothetical protein [Deltaproteobacteria bacterium]
MMTKLGHAAMFSVGVCAVATGCGDDRDNGVNADDAFCFGMQDTESFELEPFDNDPSSGQIWGRLATDESEDIRDPNLVAFVDYTLQSIDVGGSAQRGETDDGGEFEERVGAGQWRLRLSAIKGGYQCENDLELTVEAGMLTVLCVDVGCE